MSEQSPDLDHGHEHGHEHAGLSPAARARIRAVVRRLVATEGARRRLVAEGMLPAARKPAPDTRLRLAALAEEEGALATRQVEQLLAGQPAECFPALFTAPELAQPAVALALFERARAALTDSKHGASEHSTSEHSTSEHSTSEHTAADLARLGLAVTSRVSGEIYPASFLLDLLGEGWLVLSLCHLASGALSQAEQAYGVSSAILIQSEASTGDANLHAEMLATEGLVLLAGGAREMALGSLREALDEYSSLGDEESVHTLGRMLATASLSRPRSSARPLASEAGGGIAPLEAILARLLAASEGEGDRAQEVSTT